MLKIIMRHLHLYVIDMMNDMTKLSNKQHAVINDIMDNFEFDKVLNHMKHVDWTWASENYALFIPEIADLRSALRDLIVHAFNNINTIKENEPDYKGVSFASTGGFSVYVHADDSCEAYFSVTDWQVDPNDL